MCGVHIHSHPTIMYLYLIPVQLFYFSHESQSSYLKRDSQCSVSARTRFSPLSHLLCLVFFLKTCARYMMKNSQNESTAKTRWNILIRAVKNQHFLLETWKERKFFSVFKVEPIVDYENDDHTWYLYRFSHEDIEISVEIRAVASFFSVEQIAGFNNTGNIRIWPSEEILSYISLKYKSCFENQKILEVGGGMSCLAGICLAKQGSCRSVHVSDGNETSVNNVLRIIARNVFKSEITCGVLVWKNHNSHNSKYDVILAADCLFFEDSQNDLVSMICGLLKNDGVALVLSPKRGNSLRKFLVEAAAKKLSYWTYYRYDDFVWDQLQNLQNTDEFEEDTQYPWADYWKSQERKFCDFCKCWIADNKPSIQFHEGGKRHKAAVAQRIKDISKKSIAAKKAEAKMDNTIKKMEEAALKAYMRDLQENPDLSSGTDINISDLPSLPPRTVLQKATQWHEAKTPSGDVYYWHSETAESKWEVPAEGFISLKDQSIQSTATADKKQPPKAPKRKDKSKGNKSKKMKSELVDRPKLEITPEMKPIYQAEQIGSWKPFERKDQKLVDLQLPTSTHTVLKLCKKAAEDDEPSTDFKEKSVSDLDSGSRNNSFHFKKAKFRGNMRQRDTEL